MDCACVKIKLYKAQAAGNADGLFFHELIKNLPEPRTCG